MPIMSVIVNWLKGWSTTPTPATYVEWADSISVDLIPNIGLNIFLYNASPSLSLLAQSNLDVRLVEGDSISVKLIPNNSIDVVVDNN